MTVLKLTSEVLDDLNYQFLRRLQKEGLITLKTLYIDGTKIEANADRYTFVWKGTMNYHLAGLLDTIDSLYQKHNALIDENEYGIKYDIPHAHMFVIEGMYKVREVIEKNLTQTAAAVSIKLNVFSNIMPKKCVFKNAVEGFLCPKIHTEKKKYESLVENQV